MRTLTTKIHYTHGPTTRTHSLTSNYSHPLTPQPISLIRQP
ncbi:hypothetical protein [Bartonella bacilliformis]|nr:hypothetical protein [Bartonella bacilliformis]